MRVPPIQTFWVEPFWRTTPSNQFQDQSKSKKPSPRLQNTRILEEALSEADRRLESGMQKMIGNFRKEMQENAAWQSNGTWIQGTIPEEFGGEYGSRSCKINGGAAWKERDGGIWGFGKAEKGACKESEEVGFGDGGHSRCLWVGEGVTSEKGSKVKVKGFINLKKKDEL